MILLDETLEKLKTEHKAYQETDLPDASHIKFEFYYKKGGWNYFTSNKERRGYYLSVVPVKREHNTFMDGSKYYTESFTAFTGAKYFLNVDEVSRKSKKAEAEALEHVNRGIVSQLLMEVERGTV